MLFYQKQNFWFLVLIFEYLAHITMENTTLVLKKN